MGVSRVERITKNFRAKLAELKVFKDLETDAELADLIGCSKNTLTALKNDPLSVNARWVLTVEDYWQECKRKYSYD